MIRTVTRLPAFAAILSAFAVIASASLAHPQDAVPGAGAPKVPKDPAGGESKGATGMTITTSAWADGTRIPDEYTVEGKDESPAISWENVPDEAKSLVLIFDDPDAKGWVHWVIYDIDPSLKELPRGLKREKELSEPVKAKQGVNSFPKDNVGYRGPATPKGDKEHKYRLTLYALKSKPDLKAGLPAATLRERIKDLVIAQTTYMGTYSRSHNPPKPDSKKDGKDGKNGKSGKDGKDGKSSPPSGSPPGGSPPAGAPSGGSPPASPPPRPPAA